jgi:hypothetical protein
MGGDNKAMVPITHHMAFEAVAFTGSFMAPETWAADSSPE